MKKIGFLICLCLSGFLQAQFDFSSFTKDTELLKASLLDFCYLVRQDYVIEDSTGGRYGWEKKPYFNKAYSIAVLSEGHLWTSSQIAQPWQGDTLFQRFKQTYTPIKTQTYLKSVQASALSPFDSIKLNFEIVQDDLARVFRDSSNLGLSQLRSNSRSVLKNNYRALAFYVPQNESPENVELKTRLYQLDSLNWNNSDLAAAQAYNLEGKTLIGIVLLHYKIDTGRINFYFTGLLQKEKPYWKRLKPKPKPTPQITKSQPKPTTPPKKRAKEAIKTEIKRLKAKIKRLKKELKQK